MASAAVAHDHVHAGSDLELPTAELTPKVASAEILRHEIDEGLDALRRPLAGLFVSGLSAGMDIGFSLFLMAVMLTVADGHLPEPVVRLLVANMYSVGFIFVVLGRSELFTEQTTLAVLPFLGGRATVRELLRLWGVVYIANLVGAAAFAALAVFIGPALGVIDPSAFGAIAHRMTDHPGGAILASGVLAGWLMGLLSWLVAAGRDTISQVVVVWLVTAAIGFVGLHHVVLGAVEIFAGAFANQGIAAADIGRVLLFATLGNAIGGTVFVAVIKYGLARPEGAGVVDDIARKGPHVMPEATAPYGRKTQKAPAVKEVHILWTPDGLSCDGDTVSVTAATQPSIEDIVMGAIPGLPKVHLHNRVLDYSLGGDEYMKIWHDAAEDRLDAPFVLVVEGSIPNEDIKAEGYWAAMGNNPRTGEPITLNAWISRLAPRAFAVVAAGTCACYGGIHAMAGNPTGAMGLADYLGWDFRSKAGLPIVNVPGCPVQPDNMTETLLYLLYHAAGLAPIIPLDDQLRPTWLFGKTVHEGCDRAGYYEQADFAHEYGSPKCLVKIGCWGPVVNCNVTKRGWMNGIGGCPNVGGICIACTMPGFPDKFMPFMDEPPGATLSSATIGVYGKIIRALRGMTNHTVNKEPKWRHTGRDLTTGYRPTTYGIPQ